MCRLVLITLGALLVAFGVGGLVMFPSVLQARVEEKVPIHIGKENFERFTNIPLPIQVKYYIFSVTNAQQVLADKAVKPVFRQVGPFEFVQRRKRKVVDFSEDNRKLTYREFKTFYEVRPNRTTTTTATTETVAADNQPLDAHNTYVTTLNVPLLVILKKISQLKSGIARDAATLFVNRLIEESQAKLFITQRASEVLFDGYKDKFMVAARDIISEKLGFNYDSPLYNDSFGFMYGKNGTWLPDANGDVTIYTGLRGSMPRFMEVAAWNNKTVNAVWPVVDEFNACNRIVGTDGSQFHPGVTRDKTLHIFAPLLCSSIYIKYKEDAEVHGIPLLRFHTPPEVYAAPRKSERNACYCAVGPPKRKPVSPLVADSDVAAAVAAESTDSSSELSHRHFYRTSEHLNTKPVSRSRQQQQQSPPPSPFAKRDEAPKVDDWRCYEDGFIDLSPCQKGAPLAASAPFTPGSHLWQIEPHSEHEPAKHEMYIDIEPITGSVFRAASRAQVNAYVEKSALSVVSPTLIGHFTSNENSIVPLFWVEEKAEITEPLANQFKEKLLNKVQGARKLFLVAFVVGALLIIATIINCWYEFFFEPRGHYVTTKNC